MFTPQEVQEKTFIKAVFGGYDMQSVDEFLEPLIEDYVTLYKENSVLKSKMKVLVEKLEEGRLDGVARALASLVHAYASLASLAPGTAPSATACVARKTSWNDAPARSQALTTEEYSG